MMLSFKASASAPNTAWTLSACPPHSGDVACCDDGIVAGRDDGLREGAAESGRAAGDEPGGHGS